ncbi:hypothetical protein CDV55_102949 [Aspergillus turcosus]|nr:hypothetical protein CDV55_102949 [Aspergillus turcosus]
MSNHSVDFESAPLAGSFTARDAPVLLALGIAGNGIAGGVAFGLFKVLVYYGDEPPASEGSRVINGKLTKQDEIFDGQLHRAKVLVLTTYQTLTIRHGSSVAKQWSEKRKLTYDPSRSPHGWHGYRVRVFSWERSPARREFKRYFGRPAVRLGRPLLPVPLWASDVDSMARDYYPESVAIGTFKEDNPPAGGRLRQISVWFFLGRSSDDPLVVQNAGGRLPVVESSSASSSEETASEPESEPESEPPLGSLNSLPLSTKLPRQEATPAPTIPGLETRRCVGWYTWVLPRPDGLEYTWLRTADRKSEVDHTSGEKPLTTQGQGSAFLLLCRGLIVDEPCDFCAKSCVVAPMYNGKALHKGSCANCLCCSCLDTESTPSPKQGSILWNMEPAKRALTAKGVEYGFIGGAALYTYGQLRMTKAVDILVPDGQVRLARHALRDNSWASSAFLLPSRGRIAADPDNKNEWRIVEPIIKEPLNRLPIQDFQIYSLLLGRRLGRYSVERKELDELTKIGKVPPVNGLEHGAFASGSQITQVQCAALRIVFRRLKTPKELDQPTFNGQYGLLKVWGEAEYLVEKCQAFKAYLFVVEADKKVRKIDADEPEHPGSFKFVRLNQETD